MEEARSETNVSVLLRWRRKRPGPRLMCFVDAEMEEARSETNVSVLSRRRRKSPGPRLT